MPIWPPKVKRFQDEMRPYLPILADNDDAASYELRRLHFDMANMAPVVRRSQVKADLAKVQRAIKVLANHDMPYWQTLARLLDQAAGAGDRNAGNSVKILRLLNTLDLIRREGELNDAVNYFIKQATRAVDSTTAAGNTNWKAVGAVDKLWALWERYSDDEVPKTLNPEAPFAKYLSTGFDLLNVGGDPRSAFNRYAMIQRGT
jgi:hypothetical protein